MVDLELVDTDDLVDQLLDRFDCMVVVGLACKSDNSQTISRWKTGNTLTCQGLAADTIAYLSRMLVEKLEPDEGGGE